MNGSAIIYGLADPRDGSVRYVGRTVRHPRIRLGGHRSEARTGRGGEKGRWLRGLEAAGLVPGVMILERCSAADAAEAERRWIARYAIGGDRYYNAVLRSGLRRESVPVYLDARHRRYLKTGASAESHPTGAMGLSTFIRAAAHRRAAELLGLTFEQWKLENVPAGGR